MKNAVNHNVVAALGVHRCGGQDVQDGGGTGFQLCQVRLLLTHQQALEGELLLALLFDGGLFLFALGQ